MIGRTPDGTRIWGGPYTLTQVGVAALVIVVLWKTTWLWARDSLIMNGGFAITVFAAAVFAAGQLPPGLKNPLVLSSGLLRFFRSGWNLGGRRLRTLRPKKLRQGIPASFFWTTENEPAPALRRDAVEHQPSLTKFTKNGEADASLDTAPLTPIQQLLLGDQA